MTQALVASGWRDAGLFVLAIASLTIVYTVGTEHGVHALAMLLIAMLVAALLLIASQGGPGPEALRIMAAPQSLAIGLITLTLEISYYLALLYISPAEASLLSRIAIPLSMAIAWLLLSRAPPPGTLIGHALILAAVAALITTLNPAGGWLGALLTFTTAACFVSRNFIAERHPWNRRAGTVGERVRITGLVMLSATLVGWIVAGTLICLGASGIMAPLPLLPVPADFTTLPTLLCAALVGLVILPSMFYLSFSAVVKIRTENFVAVSAFIPAVTLVLQIVADRLGIIAARPIDPRFLALTAAIIVGTLVIVRGARIAMRAAGGRERSSAPPT